VVTEAICQQGRRREHRHPLSVFRGQQTPVVFQSQSGYESEVIAVFVS